MFEILSYVYFYPERKETRDFYSKNPSFNFFIIFIPPATSGNYLRQLTIKGKLSNPLSTSVHPHPTSNGPVLMAGTEWRGPLCLPRGWAGGVSVPSAFVVGAVRAEAGKRRNTWPRVSAAQRKRRLTVINWMTRPGSIACTFHLSHL